MFLFVYSFANASITDLKLSTAQTFDVQWYTSGGKLYASGFNYIYASINYATQTASAARLTSSQYADINSVAGRYIGFFNSTTNPGTYGMAVFNPDGTKYKILNNTGTFVALADGAIFYNGNGMWGTLITTGAGYTMGSSGNWTITQSYPTNTQLQSYTPPSSTPLSAGQTAQTTPTYTSIITSAQSTRYDAAVARRNAITSNSIYVEQVGNNNSIQIDQKGPYNKVAGINLTSIPIQGDWNNIKINQGDSTSTGKNLTEMTVYGSYNSLTINQGRDNLGFSTGTDKGGHIQSIYISGDSNTVTTRQQNTAVGYGHYLETNITGNYNNQNIVQTGNAIKKTFVSTTGNLNTLSALQDGLGDHYMDVTMNGNSNDAIINQTGNTKNAATIILNNSGSPASITLNQAGGQTYNIERTCTTTCGRVTVSQ